MKKEIINKYFNNHLKADPQNDPIWFTSLEYEGNFTMDLDDVLSSFADYLESLNDDAIKGLLSNAMDYHRSNLIQKVGTILQEEIEDSEYKNDFITDILRKIR